MVVVAESLRCIAAMPGPPITRTVLDAWAPSAAATATAAAMAAGIPLAGMALPPAAADVSVADVAVDAALVELSPATAALELAPSILFATVAEGCVVPVAPVAPAFSLKAVAWE
jgi:hypothetical protein